MSTKVNKSVKRRMNALLQIALIRAVDVHGYKRPEVAQCYKTDSDRAHFYFESADGLVVGFGEHDDSVDTSWTNELIIKHLITAIRIVTGYAEHNYRRQIRQAAQTAFRAHPESFRSIAACVYQLAK